MEIIKLNEIEKSIDLLVEKLKALTKVKVKCFMEYPARVSDLCSLLY